MRVESFDYTLVLFFNVILNFLVTFSSQIQAATIEERNSSNLDGNDFSDITTLQSEDQKFTVYRDAIKRECYLERTLKTNPDQEPHSKTLFVGNLKISPTDSIYKELGQDVLNFCKNYSMLTAEERVSNVKSNRQKRQIFPPKKPSFRGQTQTQFVSFDNEGKNDTGGTAEATAEQDKSRASVHGRLGMGQAQSQSGSADPCEELAGSFRPAGQFGSSYPTGQGSNVAGAQQSGQYGGSTLPSSLPTPGSTGTFYPNGAGSAQQAARIPGQSGDAGSSGGSAATHIDGTGVGGGGQNQVGLGSVPAPGTSLGIPDSRATGSFYPQQAGVNTYQPGYGQGGLIAGSGQPSYTSQSGASGFPQGGGQTAYPQQFTYNPQQGYIPSSGTDAGRFQGGTVYPSGYNPQLNTGSANPLPSGYTPGSGSLYGTTTYPSGAPFGPGFQGSGANNQFQPGGAVYPTGSYSTQPQTYQPIYGSQGGSGYQQPGGFSVPGGGGYPQTGISSLPGGGNYPQMGVPPQPGAGLIPGGVGHPRTGITSIPGGGSYSPTGASSIPGGAGHPQTGAGGGYPQTGISSVPGVAGYPQPGVSLVPGGAGFPQSGTSPIPGAAVYPHTGTTLIPGGVSYPQTGAGLIPGGTGYPQTGITSIPGGGGYPSTGSSSIPGGTGYPQTGVSSIPGGGSYPQTGINLIPGGGFPLTGSSTIPGGANNLPNGVTSISGGGSYPQTGAGLIPGGTGYPQTGVSSVPGGGSYPQTGSSTIPGGANYLPTGVSSVPGGGSYPQTGAGLIPAGVGYPQTGITSIPGGGSYPSTGSGSIPGGTGYPQTGVSSVPGGGSYPQTGITSIPGGGGFPSTGSSTIPGGANYLPTGVSSVPVGGNYPQTGPSLIPGGVGYPLPGGAGFPQTVVSSMPGTGGYPQTGSTSIPGVSSIPGAGGYPQGGVTSITGNSFIPQGPSTSQINASYPPGSTQYTPQSTTGYFPGSGSTLNTSSSSQINSLDTASGESQSLSSLNLHPNGTHAAASAQGKTRNGMAQAEVSGTYTGSFSAQAQTSDNEKSVQTQIFGNTTSASSSSQGKAGKSESQSQMQYNYNNGATLAESQGSGLNYNTNSQIQVGNRGGIADAQSTGPGSTSSQAQIGFLPTNLKRKDQTALFEGGGTSSSQNGPSSGHSETQLQGSFKSGISFSGSAQSSAGEAQNKTKLVFDSSDLSSAIDDTPNPISTTEPTAKQIVKKENDIVKSTVPLSSIPQNDQRDATRNAALRNQPTQHQDAAIKSQKYDAVIDRDSIHVTNPFLNSGQVVPGTDNYRIPNGFKGKVVSTAGDTTHATASSLGHAQTQTVLLKPGKGKVTINNRNQSEQQKLQQDSNFINKARNPYDEYVTVTKSETGELSSDKKFAHTYYTKSSTCGYFTFTCNYIDGSEGRTKICTPGPLTYSDGTPC